MKTKKAHRYERYEKESEERYNIPKVMDLSLKHKRKADVTIKMSNTRQTSSPSGLPASFVVISFGGGIVITIGEGLEVGEARKVLTTAKTIIGVQIVKIEIDKNDGLDSLYCDATEDDNELPSSLIIDLPIW
ncbi:14105_t:CDS:2 [Rhizophagus irregularis]|nr:14105_t:CDS:2 [Rhizophagus irregularis]